MAGCGFRMGRGDGPWKTPVGVNKCRYCCDEPNLCCLMPPPNVGEAAGNTKCLAPLIPVSGLKRPVRGLLKRSQLGLIPNVLFVYSLCVCVFVIDTGSIVAMDYIGKPAFLG